MDLDEFKFDEFVLRDTMILDTSMTYFNEGIFGQPKLKKDLYHHFGSDAEQNKVKEVGRRVQ